MKTYEILKNTAVNQKNNSKILDDGQNTHEAQLTPMHVHCKEMDAYTLHITVKYLRMIQNRDKNDIKYINIYIKIDIHTKQ